jgi:4'-phosphopantetheinyl transferase EntD
MLERILPPPVAVVSTRAELAEEQPFAAEQALVERAVEKRRREFLTGRACARRALARLDVTPQAIPTGERGEPIWPDGIVASITHCDGFRACAAARDSDLLTIGIDAEPNEPLPAGLRDDIAFGPERRWVDAASRAAPSICWDRLLFSAKESVYKAWFPLAGRWLGFEDAELEIDREGAFSARLLVRGPRAGGEELRGFSGRWLLDGDLLLTAIAVPAREPSRREDFDLRPGGREE